MSKPFKTGLILGRFQHVHKGHEMIINKGLELCDNLLILIGSSQESGTVRNPFDWGFRAKLIRKIYGNKILLGHIDDMTNENDHSTEWGDYVIAQSIKWSQLYGVNTPHVMISGVEEDRMSWFGEGASTWLSHVILPRGEVDISATELREFLVENDLYFWKKFTNSAIHNEYNDIRKHLMMIEEYKKMEDSVDEW